MTKSDFKEFGKMMLIWGEMAIGSEKDKNPSDEKIFLYFCALSDIELSVIKRNANLHFTQSDWFPGISSLRNPIPLKDRAITDFEYVKKVLQSNHHPDNVELCRNIKKALINDGRSDLIDITLQFLEEFYRSKPSILRSQFINSYKASIRTKELKAIAENQSIMNLIQK